MEEENNPRYGVTGAVSFRESDEKAVARSAELREFLEASGFFESEESAQHRERVLGRLDHIVKMFVASVAPTGTAAGGKIFTFGSYRLGVHDRGADIDTLCVAPRYVTRRDFFDDLFSSLKSDPGVSEITKIEDAYVPLIKMVFNEISIDLTFARLGLPAVKDGINLLSDSVLRSMDEKCIVSLNGSRVTDAILSLVPRPSAFHDTLRAVKLWAKHRRVYGAAYGYFGGVAYAICVARICQMYPRASPFDLLLRFFETLSAWKWPAPILLRPVADLGLHLKIWDPRIYPADKYHRMPVITPAYPAMCSTHNVTQSTAALIGAEFSRAHSLLLSGPFHAIFEPADFFRSHKLFLCVGITAQDADDALPWCGYVESKIRILSTKLENVENITSALPFPKAFKIFRSKEPSNVSVASKEDANKESVNESVNKEGVNKKNVNENIKNMDENGAPAAHGDSDEAPGRKAEMDNKICDTGGSPAREKRKGDFEGGASKARKVGEKGASNNDNTADGFAIQQDEPSFSASFFIAVDVLITKNSAKKLYIDGPIKEFLDFVNLWDKKTPGMKLKITSARRKEILSFIRNINKEEAGV